MGTPESNVKKQVRALLRKYGAYYLQPVQWGIGGAGLDFHCGMKVRHLHIGFYVEAKDKDKPPTMRQQNLMDDLRKLSAKVFLVDGDITLRELERYLIKLSETDQLDSNDEYPNRQQQSKRG